VVSDVSNDTAIFVLEDETFYLYPLTLEDRGTAMLRIFEKQPLFDTASSQNT
jgi:hypothetical protein